MVLLEYLASKLAKKKSTQLTKTILNEVAGLMKALVVGMLKWALWVFNELLPKWVRIALFFVVLYFLYFSYQQLKEYGGIPRIIGDFINAFMH
ncbi:hypothetical protein MKX42_23695 [Paenibacillus sp. FSL R7-0204]|uniref:hypothetical protein n=1 Tax=Paenibacillus sp. FSL R7-0204 TaxID=2921675 RepID=UPI0030F68015